MVVLTIMTGNDIRNNSKRLQNDDGRPYFVMKDGQLSFDDSFRQSSSHVKTVGERLGYAVIDHSRLAQLGYQARNTWRKRRAVAEARGKFGDEEADVGLDTLIYRQPENQAWKDAWEVTEGLFSLIHNEVKSHGARFLAVTLSNTHQVNPDMAARQTLMDKLRVSTLSYADDRIRALGAREGFRVLNLAPPLQDYVKARGAYLHGFSNTPKGAGHWNEEGHRVVAALMTRAICERTSSEAGNTR